MRNKRRTDEEWQSSVTISRWIRSPMRSFCSVDAKRIRWKPSILTGMDLYSCRSAWTMENSNGRAMLQKSDLWQGRNSAGWWKISTDVGSWGALSGDSCAWHHHDVHNFTENPGNRLILREKRNYLAFGIMPVWFWTAFATMPSFSYNKGNEKRGRDSPWIKIYPIKWTR